MMVDSKPWIIPFFLPAIPPTDIAPVSGIFNNMNR